MSGVLGAAWTARQRPSGAPRPLRSRLLGFWPIARTGLGLVLRRRLFWVFLVLALANFLFFSAMVYFLAELKAEFLKRGRSLPPFVESFVFTGNGRSYRDFVFSQNVVVMLFLALAGSVLVGNDLRARTLTFYLAKPIGRLQYFLGKLTAAAALAALITLVPALLLYLEYGVFTESLDYFRSSTNILGAILAYGALVSVSSSVLLLGIAAGLERPVAIVSAWAALFLFLPVLANLLRSVTETLHGEAWLWGLLDFWSLLGWLSSSLFGLADEVHPERVPWALGALALWVLAAAVVFWRRVRAVEVVR